MFAARPQPMKRRAWPNRSTRRGAWVAGPLLLASLSVLGCADSPPPESPELRGVVLVVIDTLRADHLGAYGYARETSPRLDAFAADATLFENAVSPSPWTLPALATIMTSLYPSIHGADTPSPLGDTRWLFDETFAPASALDDSRTTLAEILRADGFATAGFVEGSFPAAVFGVGQGFDVYRDNDTPGVRFDVESLLEWLDEEQPERFFIYLHTVEVHSPYLPIEMQPLFEARNPDAPIAYYEQALEEERERFLSIDFDPGYTGRFDGDAGSIWSMVQGRRRGSHRDLEHIIALYDRGIAYTDYWMGQLFDGLAARGLYDETLLIVTSDHGDEFLEHGGVEHSRTYFEEMLRVPLIVRDPREGRGEWVPDQVGLVDILPTVLDVLGVENDGKIQGRSLRPFLRGEALPARTEWGEASQVAGLRALRTNRWKYVHRAGPDGTLRGEELYDLVSDPGEQTNRCAAAPDSCAPFRERLIARDAELDALAEELALPTPEPAELDAETRDRLRELGYAEGP